MIKQVITNTRQELVLLLFCISIGVNGQVVNSTFTTSNLDYLSINYEHEVHRNGHLYGGLRFHFNTNPEKNIYHIYNRDFHSYSFQQTMGFGIGYRFDVFNTKYINLGLGMSIDYFNLGLKGYKVSFAGIDTLSGRDLLYYDLNEIEESHAVIPIDIKLELQVKLTERLKLKLYGGVGVLLNEDFSNEKYTYYLPKTFARGKYIYSFTDNYGIGLSYLLKK